MLPEIAKNQLNEIRFFCETGYFRCRNGTNYEVGNSFGLKPKIHESIQPIEDSSSHKYNAFLLTILKL
jgi:hypothetical protein